MEFEKILKSRKSLHSFTDEEVEMENIENAVETARNAPSAWNLQPWHLKIIEKDEDIEKVYESSYSQDFILEADKVLILLGDMKIDRYADEAFEDAVQKGYYTEDHAENSKSRVQSYVDRDEEWIRQWLNRNCMFFASTLINALWNQGIGSCPVRGFDQETLSESFELKDVHVPLLLVPIGYPDEDKERKFRRNVDDIIDQS